MTVREIVGGAQNLIFLEWIDSRGILQQHTTPAGVLKPWKEEETE